jgi:RHS repeat-associated protein
MHRPVFPSIILSVLLVSSFGTSTLAQAQAPVISSASPSSVPIGGQVLIGGSNFGSTQGSSTVTVDGILAVVETGSWSQGGMFIEVPPAATQGLVVVTVGGVQSNTWTQMSIVPAPSITSVSPSSGPIGTSITITGHNFSPGSARSYAVFSTVSGCDFFPGTAFYCGVYANPTSLTNTSMVVQVPPGAISGKISVAYDLIAGAVSTFTVTGTLAPVADPGLTDVVHLGSTIRLDGTQSYDLNGLPLTYQWSFCNTGMPQCSIPTGSHAVLLNSTSPTPTFIPDVSGEYDVQIMVNNGTFESPSRVVSIFAGVPAGDPIPNAGPDQIVVPGTTVQLDASGTADPSGYPLDYFWCLWFADSSSTGQQKYQGTSSFSNPNIINPTFVASLSGSYFAALSATGNSGGCLIPSFSDVVKISTVNPQPIANAGPPQNIQTPQTVQLDGTGSTNITRNFLTYSWAILSKPAGSTATINSPTFPRPTFYADVVGTYVIQLIVSNGTFSSVPVSSLGTTNRTNTVTISNLDVIPIANAGPAQTVPVGSIVNLDGTASSNVNGRSLSYNWSLISAPPNSLSSLYLPTSENPYFTADLAGKYVAQLVVSDGVVDSAPATVEISTDNSRPVANAGPHQSVLVGSKVWLSGAASSDADGNSLAYQWFVLYVPPGSSFSELPAVVNPSFVADVAGLYVVELIVNDGQLNSPPVTTWINAESANQAPVVNAGANQTITLPINTVTLSGTATDDGLPNGTLIMTWSVVSGPGTVNFFNPDEAVTQAMFSAAGTYVLKLTANDTALSTSATTTVTVNPPLDQPPVVNAGSNQAITLPANVVALSGSATDGGLPLTIAWSTVSGSGPVLFANSSTPVTMAMFVAAGVYSLQLSASNGQTSASSTVTITVNPPANTPPSGAIVLSPASAGPVYTNTAQQFQATVTNNSGPVANVLVTFKVTGPNATTGTGTTNSSGIATFSYTGTKTGVDAIVATASLGQLALASNTSLISWALQSPGITASTVTGQFFANSTGTGAFNIPEGTTPLFTQTFASIDFNPPTGSVPGMPSSIGVTTVPFTNVTTAANGSYTGSVIAQGSGYQAGTGTLSTFEAVFTGTFTVAAAGNVTFNFLNADGFVFGIGNGAQRVSGTYVNPPASTPFNGYTVMGAFNNVTSPVQNAVTVNFPAAGSYPYEVDYADSNQVAWIPPASEWNYMIANPTLGTINSILRNSNGVATVTINQDLNQPITTFAAGTQVTIAGVTDSIDFPNSTQTAQNPISFVQGQGSTEPSTTFALTWPGNVASSSGGIVSELWNLPFYLVGFNASGFGLGQAPFTNAIGNTGSQGCPLIGKSPFPVFGIVDLRKTIELPPGATNIQAQVAIDNDFTLWVNGTEVTNQDNEGCSYYWNFTVPIPNNLLVPGTNLVAVQVRDRGDVTGFDLALTGPASLAPAKPLTLVMNTNVNNGQSSLTMAPSANISVILGQPASFTVLVTNASGAPASNIPVTFNVAGVNPQQSTITTGSAGTAVFTYEGFFVGTDLVQASAQVGATPVVSTQTQVAWTYQTILPQLGTLTLSPSNAQNKVVGQTQTFTAQALNGSGQGVPNISVTLLVSLDNTQQLTGVTNSSGIATFSYVGNMAGTDTVEANAVINGTAAFSNLVTVTWTPPSGGGTTYVFTPQGWIGTPTIGAVVQTQVPIMLAAGITLTSGTLQYFPTANPSNITVLNSNTAGTGPLNLGVFDPTLLENGQYAIQLKAIASNGNSQLNEIVVSVTGENKPGRETVTVTDLKIPLAGIPINITRTYDSLNRGITEDFGNGWKLGTSVELDVDLLMNVTFTLNGKRQTFYFTPQSAGQGLFPWLMLPAYTPQPGLHGTLTSNGCGILIYSGGTLVQDQSGLVCFPAGTYLPTVYTYTDPAGRVYTMSSSGQLQTIKDLNGNTLTFAPNGITSSAGGVVVPFIRDGQGRITQITDLNQNNYIYSYDSCGTGDLCTVTFPSSGSSIQATYTYATDHSLLTQVDPNNNTWTNTYYTDPADNGRLMSVTSPSVPGPSGTSAPYVTQYAYNVATNTTTTTNPDGGTTIQTNNSFGKPLVVTQSISPTVNRTTTYAYDNNQNLISQTDSLGNTASYTYDANGNQTSVTDPAGDVSTDVYNQYSELTSATDAVQPANTTNYFYDTNFNQNEVTDSIGQAFAATYDAAGDRVTQTDANGNTTQFTYDGEGNLLKVVDPLNEVTSFTYDFMDRVLTKTDPRKNQTVYAYDALGNLTETTDPLGHVVRSTFDLNGNKLSDIDPLGRITSYAYDALNRLVTITNPDLTTKHYTYDFRNYKTSEIDQLGRTNLYQYDLAGDLQAVTYANGTVDAGTVTYAYYTNGLTQTLTDELNNVTTYSYDAASRLTSVKDALTHVTRYGYDADSRQTSITDANQHTTSYAYDARSRLKAVTYPDTTTTQYTYDGVGNQLTVTDQAQQTTTRAYDLVNRLLSVKDALSNLTQYAYDSTGNLLTITDANNHVTSFQYDGLNRKVLRVLPLVTNTGINETYSYDAMGNLSAKTDFNGKTTTYAYDTLNRLLKKTPDPSFSAPSISFTYFPTGTRQTMADATGTTSYTYDNRNRLKTKTTPEGTLNYTYDAHGNALTILSANTNGASVTYTYDPLNRLSTVTDNRLVAQGAPSGLTTYGYDPAGNMQTYTYSTNSVQSTYAYDTLNRLSQVSSSKGGALSSFTYTPYPAGNVHTVAELSGRSVTYGYDNDYHLLSETVASDPSGNNGVESYTYDAVGNRKKLTSTIPSLSGSVTYSYDANDRLSTDTYDNNGNTTVSLGITNTYDFENHLMQHAAVTIVYDGDGKRVSETIGGTTTKFLVDGKNPTGYSQVMEEIVNGAVTRTYTYGRRLISENQLVGSTWTPSFYGYDGHGNVRFLANSSGTITDSYTYDAFGMPIASTGTTASNFRYAGEWLDPNLNFYNLRARYYNQATGRFLTMDQWHRGGCSASRFYSPWSLNGYAYADNDPANRVDPLGMDAILEYEVNVENTTRKVAAKVDRSAVCDGLYQADMKYCAETFLNPSDPDTAGFETCAAVALFNLEWCLMGTDHRLPLPTRLPF